MSARKKTLYLNGIVVGDYDAADDGDLEAEYEAARSVLIAKGLHRNVSQLQALLNQARSFAHTSAYLYERDLNRTPSRGVSLVSFVVNSAFAIELYTKALGLKYGKKLRGHELVKLYQALPAQAHDDILAVSPRCARNRGLPATADFRAHLQQLNNAFVEWRYCYEFGRAGPIQVQPMIFVMEVLHEATR